MSTPEQALPDIRKGDLVKATKKGYPELFVTGRVKYASGSGVDLEGLSGLTVSTWDFEVLDRPLPPISDELLREASKAYRMAQGYAVPEAVLSTYDRGVSAVINYVRQYDNKENK